MKYKVSFSGFAYVEADSPEEAEEKAMYEDDAVYEEKKCESVEEVDEFTVSLENCMELVAAGLTVRIVKARSSPAKSAPFKKYIEYREE